MNVSKLRAVVILAAAVLLACAPAGAVTTPMTSVDTTGESTPNTAISSFERDYGTPLDNFREEPPKRTVVLRQSRLPNGILTTEDGDHTAEVAFEFRIVRIYIYRDEKNLIRIIQKDDGVVPNDPLYMRSGASGTVSKVAKGLGSIMKITGFGIGSPVEDASDEAKDQWGLHRVGFLPLQDHRSAWNIEDGQKRNGVVAVIDSGLDLTHVDGPRYLWTNSGEIPNNGLDDDGNGYVDDIHGWNFVEENNDLVDENGHGTFVAGIIAAKTNNGRGIAGINPGARIMVLKAVNAKGDTSSLNIYRAVHYAADNGARVINISVGEEGLSQLEQLAVNYAYARGCLVVVSAGNQGEEIANYGPPGLRRVFSVAALDMSGDWSIISNHGANVALTAPGESIYSLTSKFAKAGGIAPPIKTDYHRMTGTSFSAPFVAGSASLIWARNPALTHIDIENILLDSASDLGDPGWDDKTGAGLLDASRALAADKEDPLIVRLTEAFVNKAGRKVASVDLYGAVRGNLENYVVEIGEGKKPKKWTAVGGPKSEAVNYGHILRIEGRQLEESSKWTIRIVARDRTGRTKAVQQYMKLK